MILHHVTDWDNAYANSANIAGSGAWPGAWQENAAEFRASSAIRQRSLFDLAYGTHMRQNLDLFMPEAEPQGLMVFIHGGYWMAMEKIWFSHLAAGALASGFAVAIPGYRLCPDVMITDIAADVAAAINLAAGRVAGPINITGHSAGGHLATRMISQPSPLLPEVQSRIRNVVPISGVFDLRPLMMTRMNQTLAITQAEAREQSPALLNPIAGTRLTCWAGGAERAEFRRQNALLANIWTGLGVETGFHEEPDKHHFTIVDGLTDKDHPLTRALLS